MNESDMQPGDSLHVIAEIPPLGGAFGRLVTWLDRLFGVLASLALLGIAAVVLLQIFARLALPSSPAWTEELSRYLFIYMVALSSGLVLRRNRHVNVELFHQFLPWRGQLAYRALICLLVGGFALLMVPYAMQYAQIGAFQTSPTLKVPMIYIFFSTAVLFGLNVLYAALSLIEAAVAIVRGPSSYQERV
ncbi:TRAP transporter small permease [Halomonas sp. M20]|uniref:TRAP transporter small permease n=1 Tax=Halomonas sp. M20 TaxID=2763264 RepID=UPI001D0AB128|nr:TRAP transporter small permease [Halomonas sp. M20]